jgi:uncharacterized protein YjbI with pentapeptide repeats
MANLSGANLFMADLSGANLNEAHLNEASLLKANLSKAEVSAYFQRYGLRRPNEADKAVEFLSSPLSRSYVFTYSIGGKLLDALFAAQGNADFWFTRLLTEAVTPSQIRAWTRPLPVN